MIPIFDVLSHPTLSGHWLGREDIAGFDDLAAALSASGYMGACAVGLEGVEGYNHESFAKACARHACLTPIAGFNPGQCDSLDTQLAHLKTLGFKGIKLHPRFSGLDLTSDRMGAVFRAAAEADLTVFLCTYYHTSIESFPLYDPFLALVRLLKHAPQCRVVLVHGGGVELLRYAELVRFNRNLLLDLSLTLCKYAGSSLDADLRFLFERFDERICIGTDHPEWTHGAVRDRFEYFSQGLSTKKKENIASDNALAFLGVKGEPGI